MYPHTNCTHYGTAGLREAAIIQQQPSQQNMARDCQDPTRMSQAVYFMMSCHIMHGGTATM